MAEEYTPPPRAVGRDAVFVRHRLSSPRVAESAYIAPTAVLSGDVTVGAHSRVYVFEVCRSASRPSEPLSGDMAAGGESVGGIAPWRR
jgi:hypothetical protein